VGKNRRSLLAGLIGIALCAFLWMALHRAEPEPMYEGKPLSAWLESTPYLGTNDPQSLLLYVQQRVDALTAIRAMGTNVVPALVRMLQQRDPPLLLKLVSLAQKQRLIPIPFVPASSHHQRAFLGLQALGPDAQSAFPDLLRVYDQSSDVYLQTTLPPFLAQLAPDDKRIIPSLLRKAADGDDKVRLTALRVLSQFRDESDLVVPALIKALQDPSAVIRSSALQMLGALGPRAKAAVPALLDLLRDPDKGVVRGQYNPNVVPTGARAAPTVASNHIESVLKDIDREAAAKAGIK
jgi:hypothetical protein